MIIRISDEGLASSTRKLNVISKKRISKNLDDIFKKNGHFAYSVFVIHGKIMVGIASGSV